MFDGGITVLKNEGMIDGFIEDLKVRKCCAVLGLHALIHIEVFVNSFIAAIGPTNAGVGWVVGIPVRRIIGLCAKVVHGSDAIFGG